MALRSCIGCKTVCEKADLLRLVLINGSVRVDRKAKLPGRGAYVHLKLACIRKGLDSKLLSHRFRCKGLTINVEDMKSLLVELPLGIE